MADSEAATDDSGQYSFTGLRAGTYSVEISGFDSNEVSFSSTSGAATVGVGESKVVSFDGTYLRTAGIMGQVSVEGEGLGGVTVTLMGQGAEATEMTDAGGLYSFSQLRSGDYTVAISGYDTDDYEFETTSKSVTIATGETANVPFDGTLLRTAGIAGRVSLDDGTGLDGVTVTLAGAAEMSAMTANGGQYSFAGLAAGTYVLSITNPNETAYSFAEDELQKTVMLEDDQSAIVNFSGTHTRTASVSGMLFIDEVMHDKMHNDGEPSVTAALAPLLPMLSEEDQMAVSGLLAKAKVKLRGPDLNTMTDIAINADGTFSTGASLMAGSYQVELPVNDDDVAAGLATAGVAFVGESMVVSVEAGGSATVNFPFRITMQTVATGARMGAGETLGVAVPGVKLALYARADGTGMLGEATTDKMGMASFTFARADNTGPAGNDNIVFVKAVDSGHESLVVSGNEFVEFSYEGVERLSTADQDKEVATLVNVAVAFDFWVKSNEEARDGDMGLGGWNTQVYMGDPEADDAMPLMMENEDGDTVSVTMATDTTKGDNLGKSSFSHMVAPTDLPAMFTVMATEGDDAGQPDMDEAWEQGDALTHTHTGLDLPPGDDDDPTDLGPIRITFTTQAIYVGVHRELDDRTGYTDFIGIGDGDGRPGKTAQGKIEISLMAADDRGRLRTFKYDHDADPKTDDQDAVATVGSSGIVSFKNIPADTEITVVADEGSGRVIVPDSRASREIDAFGDQLDDYPDGVIVGAFGDGSGARPDVWLCPLQRQTDDNPRTYCSTYAYKWDTGTISGKITGLRKGDKATVTLTPVNSNDDYEDDLADDDDITAGTGGAASYEFDDVADGRYKVTLAAKAGSWGKNEKTGLSVMHDETDEDDDYTGDSATGDLSATDLRGVIRGRIANDENEDESLTRDESRAGVMVAIHHASAEIKSGDNKGRRSSGKAVEDANGDPVMAETDGDGVFMFEGLVVDNYYFVKPVSTDLYTAVRDGDKKIASEKADDIVMHALTKAVTPFPASSEPATPTWNYHTSKATVGGGDGETNFVLLYKDGEVEGKVSDPSVRAAHSRVTIELKQCKTTNYTPADPDAGTAAVDATQCTKYTDVEVEASVDSKGNWSADDLMEGIYEVTPDLPAGYINVGTDGSEATDAAGFHSQQMVELMGGRADDGTETFHIKDRNAGANNAIVSVTIDGDACGSSDGTTWTPPGFSGAERCVDNKLDDATIAVKVTASDGATIRLSSSATEDTPKGTGTYSHAVANGEATNVTLPTGRRVYHVHVAAGDGYTKNDPSGGTTGFAARRDADVRMKSLKFTWDGGTLNLDRAALDLNTDGEDAPVTGAIDLGTITLTGSPATDGTAINASAVAMNSTFGQYTVTTGNCPATRTAPSAGGTPTAVASALTDHDSNSETPEQGAICISIGDWKSATDLNEGNGHMYQATLKRPAS